MDRKKKWLIAIGIVIVIALIVAIVLTQKQKASPEETNKTTGTDTSITAPEAAAPEVGTNVNDKFRVEAPKDIKIPEVNDKTLTAEQKKDIAVPTVVTAAAPGVESSFRSYDIKGEGGKFIPSTVIAKVGDTVHINFTAVDRDYDIVFPSYNMKQSAKLGQTKILEFQAVQDGSFVYYCEICGGLNSTAKGNIVIVK